MHTIEIYIKREPKKKISKTLQRKKNVLLQYADIQVILNKEGMQSVRMKSRVKRLRVRHWRVKNLEVATPILESKKLIKLKINY